ncbi:MAG: carbamate kinase, partial [Anaerolineales bacterium]
ILALAKAGFTVVAVGGGGIPVVENEKGELVGVEAVVDKDPASALLAYSISADLLLMATDVEKAAVNFQKAGQRWLDRMSVQEAEAYLAEGHFGKGSMEPKVRAALKFLDNGGQRAIITNMENMLRALLGETGTHILL